MEEPPAVCTVKPWPIRWVPMAVPRAPPAPKSSRLKSSAARASKIRDYLDLSLQHCLGEARIRPKKKRAIQSHQTLHIPNQPQCIRLILTQFTKAG